MKYILLEVIVYTIYNNAYNISRFMHSSIVFESPFVSYLKKLIIIQVHLPF